MGNLEYLTPEFEMDDFQDGKRFIDFAYLRPPYRIGIEIDGYGLTGFSGGWKIIRFSYDDVKEAETLPASSSAVFGKMFGNPIIPQGKCLSPHEKEILRLALRKRQR